MARVLVFSGVGLYADPWHPFFETSGAVADLLRDNGYEVVVRESEPGSLFDVAQFDLVVVNSGGRTGEAEQAETDAWADDRRALEAFHRGGGPILGLHTAIGTFPDWPGWASIIGGRWGEDSHHPDIDTATFRPAEGAATHPVWKGLGSVAVFDERYSDLELLTGSVPLVQHDTEGVQHVMGWGVGESVIYDGLGHDRRSYEAEDRRRLLLNEVKWLLARREVPGTRVFGMTEPEQTDASPDPAEAKGADAPLDPKEAMRLALERKKQNENHSAAQRVDSERDQGGRAHSQMGGKREFRRKSG